MKKLITLTLTLALALLLTFALAACGGDGNEIAVNDTPQVQETAEAAPTEAPTPEPTPDPTPEATPDDNGGNADDPSASSGESFFPNIDDSYLPDDIVKYTVGTLTASGDAMPEEAGFRPFFLRFEDVTDDDFQELSDHYKSGDVLNPDDEMNERGNTGMQSHTLKYSWGKIHYVYYYNEGKIEVTISIAQD